MEMVCSQCANQSTLLIVQILVLVIEMPIVARWLLGKIDLLIRMGFVVVDIMAPNEQNPTFELKVKSYL